MVEEIPGTHEIAFALAGVLIGVFIKTLLDAILRGFGFPEVLYLLAFVIIATMLLKRGLLLVYVYLPALFLLQILKIGRKLEPDRKLTERDMNLLVPGITISLIVFDLLNIFETNIHDYLLSFILTVPTTVLLFIISFKISEKISPL